MKFVTNSPDPRNRDSFVAALVTHTGQTLDGAENIRRQILEEYIVGEPKETSTIPLRAAKRANVVGLYVESDGSSESRISSGDQSTPPASGGETSASRTTTRDPEGYFLEEVCPNSAAEVELALQFRAQKRRESLGYVIQPSGMAVESEDPLKLLQDVEMYLHNGVGDRESLKWRVTKARQRCL